MKGKSRKLAYFLTVLVVKQISIVLSNENQTIHHCKSDLCLELVVRLPPYFDIIIIIIVLTVSKGCTTHLEKRFENLLLFCPSISLRSLIIEIIHYKFV